MTDAFDILLPLPLSAAWLHGLLFAAFFLHLLFVLFALGTAFIAVCCYILDGGEFSVYIYGAD